MIPALFLVSQDLDLNVLCSRLILDVTSFILAWIILFNYIILYYTYEDSYLGIFVSTDCN